LENAQLRLMASNLPGLVSLNLSITVYYTDESPIDDEGARILTTLLSLERLEIRNQQINSGQTRISIEGLLWLCRELRRLVYLEIGNTGVIQVGTSTGTEQLL